MKGGEFGYTFSEPEEERGGGAEDEQMVECEVEVNYQAAAPPLGRENPKNPSEKEMCHVIKCYRGGSCRGHPSHFHFVTCSYYPTLRQRHRTAPRIRS
jgi:hypothetical protein